MKAMERLTRRPALFPPWVVLHVPHDAITIPTDVRGQFLLTDVELREELRRMTDHFTHALFAGPEAADSIVRAPVSRLVVDVERFPDDADEPMAARGMGAIYEVTSRLVPLRRKLTAAERETLLATYYRPHHAHLELVVSQALERFGRCLVLDCHSFPSVALPYEQANPTSARPDICIGTDEFHTNAKLAGAFLSQIGNVGPDLGQSYIIDSFLVVVLGGVGQLAGSVFAAFGLGIANKVLEPAIGAVLGKILILGLIILFIQKRPQGIFAVKGREA